MKYARMNGDTAVDVRTDSPDGVFTEEIAAEFIEVPDKIENGWTFVAGQWSAPVVPEPAPVVPVIVPPKVGPIHFQMLFTPEEAITADTLKATDKGLASFWKLVDDPRTDTIDLGLQSVQNAITYTLTAVKNAGVAVDVPARLAAILSGVLS